MPHGLSRYPAPVVVDIMSLDTVVVDTVVATAVVGDETTEEEAPDPDQPSRLFRLREQPHTMNRGEREALLFLTRRPLLLLHALRRPIPADETAMVVLQMAGLQHVLIATSPDIFAPTALYCARLCRPPRPRRPHARLA